jgi:hypothetical protein
VTELNESVVTEKTCCPAQNIIFTEDILRKGLQLQLMYKQLLFTKVIENTKLWRSAWLHLEMKIIK